MNEKYIKGMNKNNIDLFKDKIQIGFPHRSDSMPNETSPFVS